MGRSGFPEGRVAPGSAGSANTRSPRSRRTSRVPVRWTSSSTGAASLAVRSCATPSSLVSLRRRSLRFCWAQRRCITRGHADEEEPLVGIPGAILWFEHSDEGACEEIFGVGIGSRMPRRDRVQPLANVAFHSSALTSWEEGTSSLITTGICLPTPAIGIASSRPYGLARGKAGGVRRSPLSQGREGSPARARGSTRAPAEPT